MTAALVSGAFASTAFAYNVKGPDNPKGGVRARANVMVRLCSLDANFAGATEMEICPGYVSPVPVIYYDEATRKALRAYRRYPCVS